MPKHARKKRKTRGWRGLRVGVEEFYAKKAEKELKKPQAPKSFFIDKNSQAEELTPQQRRMMARSKKLSYELACDPFPHIGPTCVVPLKKAKWKAQRKVKPASAKQREGSATTEPAPQYFDLWEVKNEDPFKDLKAKHPEVETEYLEPVVPIKPPEKKPSSFLPAVEVPHPGASYNPLPKAYNELLKDALKEEEKHRREFNRVMSSLQPERRKDWGNEVEPFPAEKAEIEEESQAEEEAEDDGEGCPLPGKREYQAHEPRKTQSEINKGKRKKLMLKEMKLREKLKESKKRLQMIEQFQKEIHDEETQEKLKKALRDHRKLEKMYKARKLGRERFEKPDVEVLLPEQLPKSLRHTRVTTSDPVRDRFVSFQKRNIIEARSFKLKYSKYKPKFVEKYSYRMYSKEQERKYKDL